MFNGNNALQVEVRRPPVPRCERELIRSRELSATTILITVSGEIDAATGPEVFAAVEARLRGYRQLVLDLSQVEFFGTAGYSELHRVHSHCARSTVGWVLVAGAEVQRLLRLCDPEGIFPIAANIVSAVAALVRGPHHAPRLGLAVR